MGFNKMIIGCLKGNLANEFYKHMGGKFIKIRIFEKLQVPENVYYFDNMVAIHKNRDYKKDRLKYERKTKLWKYWVDRNICFFYVIINWEKEIIC